MYTYSLVLDDVYWSRGYNRILTFSGCRQQETQCSYTAQHPCSRQLWHSKRTAWSVSQHPDDKTRPNGHTYPGYTPHMTNVQLHQCAIHTQLIGNQTRTLNWIPAFPETGNVLNGHPVELGHYGSTGTFKLMSLQWHTWSTCAWILICIITGLDYS